MLTICDIDGTLTAEPEGLHGAFPDFLETETILQTVLT